MPQDSRLPGHLLFATDISARCDRARDRAVALARAWGAKLTVVHALDMLDAPNDQPSRPTVAGGAQRALRVMQADFADVGDIAPDFVVLEGKPQKVVLEVAEDRACDMIVTGIAGNSPLGQTVLGSTVTALSRHAPVPVLVVKRRPHAEYGHILVASDFSRASKTVLDTAVALFSREKIGLFHAFEPHVGEAAADEAARAFLADDGDVDVVSLPGRDPAVAIADHVAEADVELVVIGSHGARGLMTVLLGSTAIAVLDETPCDVLVVPLKERSAA